MLHCNHSCGLEGTCFKSVRCFIAGGRCSISRLHRHSREQTFDRNVNVSTAPPLICVQTPHRYHRLASTVHHAWRGYYCSDVGGEQSFWWQMRRCDQREPWEKKQTWRIEKLPCGCQRWTTVCCQILHNSWEEGLNSKCRNTVWNINRKTVRHWHDFSLQKDRQFRVNLCKNPLMPSEKIVCALSNVII